MTEYDCSPQAQQHARATHDRVSRWTHQTSKITPANPFERTPSEIDSAEHSDFYSSSSHSHSRSSHSHSHSVPTSRYPSPDVLHRGMSGGGYRPSPRSHSHSRSSATSSSSATTYAPRMHPSRSHTTPHGLHSSHHSSSVIQPVRSYSHPTGVRAFAVDPRVEKVILPPPNDGQTYVIIPPDGRRVDVVSHDSTNPVPIQYLSSPTRKAQPLLKRIFSNHAHPHAPSPSPSHPTRSPSLPPSRSSSEYSRDGYRDGYSRRHGVESGGKPRRSHRRGDSY